MPTMTYATIMAGADPENAALYRARLRVEAELERNTPVWQKASAAFHEVELLEISALSANLRTKKAVAEFVRALPKDKSQWWVQELRQQLAGPNVTPEKAARIIVEAAGNLAFPREEWLEMMSPEFRTAYETARKLGWRQVIAERAWREIGWSYVHGSMTVDELDALCREEPEAVSAD